MQEADDKTVTNPLKRGIYFSIGIISLAIGIVGVFLPVIPTTPLILLSAWCFFRSSSRLYRWVVSNERLGPTIVNFQEGRGITTKIKIRAIVMMWLTISVSIYFFITNIYLIAFLYLVAIVVTIYLFRLPTLMD